MMFNNSNIGRPSFQRRLLSFLPLIDEINPWSIINSIVIAAAILNLELQNVVNGLPGKMYKLN